MELAGCFTVLESIKASMDKVVGGLKQFEELAAQAAVRQKGISENCASMLEGAANG